MTATFIKAVIGISVILGGWLTVQTFWRISTGASASQDALAGRLGCHGCDCKAACQARKDE